MITVVALLAIPFIPLVTVRSRLLTQARFGDLLEKVAGLLPQVFKQSLNTSQQPKPLAKRGK